MKTLAERLKFLRLKRGFKSKSVAAQAIEISYGTYQGYEYGLLPGRNNYKKIADFYGCSLLWLRDGEGDPFPSAGGPDPARDHLAGVGKVIDTPPPRQDTPPTYSKDASASSPRRAQPEPQAHTGVEIRISEALRMTASVLESGTSYATALYLNIVHFDRAVCAETTISKCQEDLRTQGDLIAKMQARLDELEKRNSRFDELEKQNSDQAREIRELKRSSGDSPPIALTMAHAARTGTEDPAT